MALSLPGPAVEWLWQRGELQVLGAILPPERHRQAVGGSGALLRQARDGIDEASLVEARQQGVIAGARLDVFENEPRMAPKLADCTGAVLLTHLGGANGKTLTAWADAAARNILETPAGRSPIACASPEVSWCL
jgi:phosphoglycerate dehydrogenase-like enzyme